MQLFSVCFFFCLELFQGVFQRRACNKGVSGMLTTVDRGQPFALMNGAARSKLPAGEQQSDSSAR